MNNSNILSENESNVEKYEHNNNLNFDGDEDDDFYFIKPSEFIQNRGKILEDFIKNKNDNITKKNNVKGNSTCSYFEAIPNIVSFTSYTPFNKYEKIVSLKNIDGNAKSIRFELESNDAFKVSYVSDIKKKVAPGMLFTFKIAFYPKSCDNYNYNLKIYSELLILPIRCMNDEIILDVQDEIIVNDTPIYMKGEKIITIKNIGKYDNKFEATVNPPFYINSCIHELKGGEIEDIKIVFLPVENKIYEDYMIFSYENGMRTYTKIQGKGIIANVSINNKEIISDDIYINETKEINIFIKNLSFFLLTWKIINYRSTLSEDITQVNFEEKDIIIEKTFISDRDLIDENIIEKGLYIKEENEDCDNYSSDYSNNMRGYKDEYNNMEMESRSSSDGNVDIISSFENEETDETKYRSDENSEFCFKKSIPCDYEQSDNSLCSYNNKRKSKEFLNIYPKYGKLYSDTNTTINISFSPYFASFYKIDIYLYIKGYKKREKLSLYLKSVTPNIIIPNNIQNVNKILINTYKEIFFELINDSEYNAPIKIEKEDDYYNEFLIQLNEFDIPKKSTYLLKIIYMPKINGSNNKKFIIHKKYTNVKNNLYISTECIFPDISFDEEAINFNIVSHSFEYKKTFNIINNSELSLHYSLNIPEEFKNEINIVEADSILKSFEKKQILIKFCPKHIKTYNCNIELFLYEIREYKKVISFYAICEKAEIICEPSLINIESMIIDKNYKEEVKIINKSENVDAMYELFIDEKINEICNIDVSPKNGIIERNNCNFININIESKIIGYILIVIKIKISGYDDFLFLNIKALSACPTIKIIPNIIDFKKCACLDINEKTIEIKNESPIRTFINLSNESSIFSYSENNFFIESNESYFVNVYAKCLETIQYNDVLNVNVHRKENIMIPLKAQGIGSPILISEKCIIFDEIHTNKKNYRELIIFNKGINERSIYLTFESEKNRAKKSENAEIFDISPRNFTIKGCSEIVCIISGYNNKEEKCEDTLYIYEDCVNKKKSSNNLKKIKILAKFVDPVVEISEIEKFFFDFDEQNKLENSKTSTIQEEKECNPQILDELDEINKCENNGNEVKNNNTKIVYMKDLNKLMQEIEIKNQQNAIVKFVLSTKVPFYVESDVIELKSKEAKKVPIYFDIDFMNTKINNIYEEHLIVNFFENGKRQKCELFGETIYPNIIMNKNLIDFQYILKNLFAQETVEIKNVCNFKVYFKWFFEENNLYEGFSNAFVVNPSKGYLLPFEKKLITITYNSINDNYYNVNMLCSVKNGPVYSLKLIAGYSDIKYVINKKELNFNSHYKSITEDIITIQNTGKIKLYIEIIYSIKFPSLLYTNVNNFFIEPHNSKDIIFYFTAGIPSNITENILIKICNFEEINIKLNSCAFYSILDLNIHDKFDVPSNKKEYGKVGSENLLEDNKEYELTYDDNKNNDYLKKIEKLMNNNLVLFEGPICYYEKQKKLLITKLKKLYLNTFLSHKKHIQEILDIYYSHTNENGEMQNADIGNMEANCIGEDNSDIQEEKNHKIKLDVQNGKTNSKNIQVNDESNNFDENQLSLSNVSKHKYEIIAILKKYCSKNTADSIFVDLLNSFICSKKNDNYILDTFSKMKELVNYEKLYCHTYLNNESILKYLKRVILETNVELKEYHLDVGKLIINEERECIINIKNISNDKINLNYNLKECENNDIVLVNYPNEISKNDSVNFKIKIKKNSLEEKSFIEKVYIYLNDNNYYTVNVKFDYVVPDILLYYNQIRFEEIEVKRCVCKINRLINTKNVNIKFKIKNITFYNKKLEYCHLKKKTQIFISPIKGIIKNNSFLDIRIFFEPSKVYKNAKVCIEIFIYHSNIVKTLDIYLNSINDNIVVNPHEITIKPLLLNSGYIYENIKIKNLNNYSKNLHIYKLDNYYKYLESFIYDILVIHNHIYIEKNDDKEMFYTNLIYYLIEIYREKIDKIKKCRKIEINGTTEDTRNEDDKHEELKTSIKKDVIHDAEKNEENQNGVSPNELTIDNKNSGEFDKIKKDKKTKEKDSKKSNRKKAEKKARLNEKKDIDILANVFYGNKYGSKELIIDTDDEEKSVKILENKIMVLEKIIIKNQIKYNYFEEYLKIIKSKKKKVIIKNNYLVVCPKYINHTKFGRHLLNMDNLNYSKMKNNKGEKTKYDNKILTINKIIKWCNEIYEKYNYPTDVKDCFIKYVIYEQNYNNPVIKNRVKIPDQFASDNRKIKGGRKSSILKVNNIIKYYISEVLNVLEKTNDEENDAKKEITSCITKTNDIKNVDKIPNEKTNDDFEKTKINDKKTNNKLINIDKNTLKRKLNLKNVKSKIDNKHTSLISNKKGENNNKYMNITKEQNKPINNNGEKTFFNKYNLKYKLEYLNYFYQFSLLHDEIFINDLKSFLKITGSDTKKHKKNENNTKKKNISLDLFESILKKMLLSPFYIEDVVFFFKKNNYINLDILFKALLNTFDGNIHIIYLNPLESHENFFSSMQNYKEIEKNENSSKGTTELKKKEGETNHKTKEKKKDNNENGDNKLNNLNYGGKIKFFYENLLKKYQIKIEKKLKEKETLEKIIEILCIDVNINGETSILSYLNSNEKKKIRNSKVQKNILLKDHNEKVDYKEVEKEAPSPNTELSSYKLQKCFKKNEQKNFEENNEITYNPHVDDTECLEEMENIQCPVVEKLYKSLLICQKEKKDKMPKQILNYLTVLCIKRNEHIDNQIIKYNKKVNKINNYIKNGRYMDCLSFYKELKIILLNLIKEYSKKDNNLLSDSSGNVEEDNIVDLSTNKNNNDNNINKEINKKEEKNKFLKQIKIKISDNFIEELCKDEISLKNLDKSSSNTSILCNEIKINEKNMDEKIIDEQIEKAKDSLNINCNKIHKIDNQNNEEKERNASTIINTNNELIKCVHPKFVQMNFTFFFINDEINFRKKSILKDISNFIEYNDVKTSAYFFDISEPQIYDTFNLRNFIQSKKKLEKYEAELYIDKDREEKLDEKKKENFREDQEYIPQSVLNEVKHDIKGKSKKEVNTRKLSYNNVEKGESKNKDEKNDKKGAEKVNHNEENENNNKINNVKNAGIEKNVINKKSKNEIKCVEKNNNKIRIQNSNENTFIEESYDEILEKNKYEIKDEYDYIFYNLSNLHNSIELIDNIKNDKGQSVIEFLQIDTSYDQKDEIRYKNITNAMLEKNNYTEIYLKVNTCKIVNIKKKVCLIDILGNYIFLNIHIIIDKPKIYSNPYFIFGNNVSINNTKNKCFIISKKLYNFDKVLIGKKLSAFNDIIDFELRDENKEYLNEFLKTFEGTHLSKFNVKKNKKEKISIPSINNNERGFDQLKNNSSNIDIYKHLLKHFQVMNLFNSSHFDCFVELSFENMKYVGKHDKKETRYINSSCGDSNNIENFLVHNDFYVYPRRFSIPSKKYKKIIILFLPKTYCCFEEKLLLSIYSINDKINRNNVKEKEIILKNDKNDILKDKTKHGSLLNANDNGIKNYINMYNKQNDNYLYDIFSLVLKGEGIKCNLKIEQNYLNFHKILLKSIQKKTTYIKNNSYCDISWFIDPNDLKGDDLFLHINPMKGKLSPNEKAMLTATINTNSANVIKKDIKINYVEKEKKIDKKRKKNSNMVYFVPLKIEAEICKSFSQISYEIVENKKDNQTDILGESQTCSDDEYGSPMIERYKKESISNNISFLKSKHSQPNSKETEDVIKASDINLKYVKVNESKTCLFKIKNTGKVKISFFVEINEHNFLNFAYIDKICDTINPNETKIIKLKLKSFKKIKFENVPLVIHIYDIENNYLHQSYKYLISVIFDYNYFRIIPSVINYDVVEIKKEEKKIFKIINDGYFDFKYDIKLIKFKIKNKEDDKIVNQNKFEEQKKENRQNKVDINPFTISPISGIIKSKEEQTVTVLFNSSDENYYKYIYFVEVDNVLFDVKKSGKNVNHKKNNGKQDKYNGIVKILASSVKPSISCDIKNIFEEVLVLKNIENCNNFLGQFLSKNSYYNIDENTLYYKYSYVNEPINERVKISNISNVNAYTKIELKEIDRLSNDTNDSNNKGNDGKKDIQKQQIEKRKKSPFENGKQLIQHYIRIEDSNIVKSKWNFPQFIESSHNNSNVLDSATIEENKISTFQATTVLTRYQHKYVDLCFYSNQIACKKYIVNIYLVNSENSLCFSFYINVEFFLPSINLTFPISLLKQQRDDKIIDLGNININSIISFKVKLKNSYKYPAFVKVYFTSLNTSLECIDDKGESENGPNIKKGKEISHNKQANNLKDNKYMIYDEENNDDNREKQNRTEQLKDGDYFNQIDDNVKINNENSDIKIKNKKDETNDKKLTKGMSVESHLEDSETIYNDMCIPCKKDIYNISNNYCLFNNITDNILVMNKNNVTHFDYNNVKNDIIYKNKKIKKQMVNIGYLYYIGNRNYVLKENDVAYFKIKIDKQKIKNEIENKKLKIIETNDINNNMPNDGLESDIKKRNKNNKKNEENNDKGKNMKESYNNSTRENRLIGCLGEKGILGSISINVLHNNYEFYNLKFVGNIIESKNYWNLEKLKNGMKNVYKNDNMYIFKNHINFDLIPIKYNNVFKIFYINENDYPLYFNIELDKKMKNFIKIEPLNGLIPENSSFIFYLHIDIKEAVNLVKKEISCKFSPTPFNIKSKKSSKIKEGAETFDGSLYISLVSDEIKVSYNKKKLSFKNITYFNYSQNELILENLSNVKLFAELNIIPLDESDDITNVYSFTSFKEKDIISLLKKKKHNEVCSLNGNKENETNYVDSLTLDNKETININKDGNILEKPKSLDYDENLNTTNGAENENKPIHEFYLTRYDLNATDLGDNPTMGKIKAMEPNRNKNKIIKKFISINGKCKKSIYIYFFHYIYKKKIDAFLHIKIKYYNEIKIPINVSFDNYVENDVLLLTDFMSNENLNKMDSFSHKKEHNNKVLIISRGILNKIHRFLYILNLSNKSYEYFFEKCNEIDENNDKNSDKYLYTKNYMIDRYKTNSRNSNNIECFNSRGVIKEDNVFPIKFLFNIFNSNNYKGDYNFYLNDKIIKQIGFETKIIEPLVFFNTSSMHINNLIVGKLYCFIFYIINFDLMDINFEFDKNSYNSFNNKKETIKIIPFKGVIKSCYRKNKCLFKHINKYNNNFGFDEYNNKDELNDGISTSSYNSNDTSNSLHENNYNENFVSYYNIKNNEIEPKKDKRKLKVKMNYLRRENSNINDDNSDTCSSFTSSEVSVVSSDFNFNILNKEKKKYINNNDGDIENRLALHKQNMSGISNTCGLENMEYIDRNSEYNSESSISLSDYDIENDDDQNNDSRFLVDYYLKNVDVKYREKFKREIIDKYLGKGKYKKIKLLFKPHLEQFYNFNLLCKVNTKEEPIKLNFKMRVSKININCYINTFDNEQIRLNLEDLISNGERKKTKQMKNMADDKIIVYSTLDFKDVLVGKKRVSNIVIENLGDFDIVYKYHIQKKDDYVSIKYNSNYIKKNSSPFILSVEYKPRCAETYENYLILNIGDYYLLNFKICAVSTNLLINFSFHNYDFGNVILFPNTCKNKKNMNGIMPKESFCNENFSSSNSSVSYILSTYKNNKKKLKKERAKDANILKGNEHENQQTNNEFKKETPKKQKNKKKGKTDIKYIEEADKNELKESEETKTIENTMKSPKMNKHHKDTKKTKKIQKIKDPQKEHNNQNGTIEKADKICNFNDIKKENKSGIFNNTIENIKNVEDENESIYNDINALSEEEENINSSQAKLIISNNSDEDCYIEYELNECYLKILSIDKRIHLKKKSKITVLILFAPTEEKTYSYKIPFKIVSDVIKTVYISFTGAACNFKLPFSCNNSNEINFKDVQVDKECIRKFTFCNKNLEDISFNILNYKYLKRNYLSFTNFDNNVFHSLKKREKRIFEIKFCPEKYINTYIPLYLNICYKDKTIPYNLTNIKLNSVCYKVILKECMLTFNKMDDNYDDPNEAGETDTRNSDKIFQTESNVDNNQLDEIKEKLFKHHKNKNNIKSRKIELHNIGDMNAQFLVNCPEKYSKYLFLYPKKGIIFSFNLIKIYMFIDMDLVDKDLYINEIFIELFPKFKEINSKLFLNVFINSYSNMIQNKSMYMNRLTTNAELANIQNDKKTRNLDIFKIKEARTNENDDDYKDSVENCDMEKNINVFSLKNETIITFLTDIRRKICKTIDIYNETESNFKIRYNFVSNEHNFFSVIPLKDSIKANDSGSLQIMYHPLFVQKKNKHTNNYHNTLCVKYLKYSKKIHHISKLIVYYPKDVIRNYTLLGYSDNTSYEERVTYKLNSKNLNNASIKIKNWINENQKLLISYHGCDQNLNPANNDMLFFYIQNTLYLNTNEEKILPFKLISLKEGIYYIMLVFSNDKYEDVYKILLHFEIVKSDYISTKTINSNKKEIIKETIFIYNPLDENIKVDAVTDYKYVFFDKSIILEKKKNNSINLYFCIVKNEESRNAIISFNNKLIGKYNFKFILNININDFEETFYFNTDLGSTQINEISFKNVCNRKINYDIIIEDYDEKNKNSKEIFQCTEKTISMKSIDTDTFLKNPDSNVLFDKINLNIIYNPSDIKINKYILKLISKEGIVYKSLLIGKAGFPKPRGPIFCSSQKTTFISFTNPFFQTKEFFLKADEQFIVSFEKIKIEGRKTAQIPIKCTATNAISGKLVIKSEDEVSWMYYLTGQ
ncbi:conserved Plasmodium protein, unknown function [Plasmodium vinckei]|uniref:Uncharacterized protein n=1 Tax=Plasmodium vinckei TaxID=5860 RepID=A0A6V7TBW3_PLAVN|nr:conserved Plasmodium protein, unknown function [Plasmodium vinckei]